MNFATATHIIYLPTGEVAQIVELLIGDGLAELNCCSPPENHPGGGGRAMGCFPTPKFTRPTGRQ